MYVAFSVDWQGKVTKIKDVIFGTPELELKIDVNKQPALDTKFTNMVDGAATTHLNNNLVSWVKIFIAYSMLTLVE